LTRRRLDPRRGALRRPASLGLLGFIMLALPAPFVLANPATNPVPVPAPIATAAAAPMKIAARPRIGLVLGGGGAKGAAHVGVLRVLDDLRIPVDCIIGTSMGALVGGTYASGMSATEVEDAIRSISWQDTIGRRGMRAQVPMRRKLTGSVYSNSLTFGVRDGRLVAPSGLLSSQNVDLTIQYLVSRSRSVSQFDDLPIPFRAIATDMQTGEMVVLDQGDLALAMRASMAVPGVFSPVTMRGRILGDGGLTRNVPVDIARQTCADVVIAVAVPNPAPTADELRSPLTLVSRTLDVLVGANERQQLETLGPDDVKIVIPMGDIGSASFDRVGDAIPLGREAAMTQEASLRRYSLSEADYLAWREGASRPGREPVTLAEINLVGLDRVNPVRVERTLALSPGDRVTPREIVRRANSVFGLSDFERVAYQLSGEPEAARLDVILEEISWGPHMLRFDVGLHVGTDSNTAFTLGGDYLRTWVNDRGGEIHGAARVGRTSGLEASFYQPLDASHRWFVEPGFDLQRSLEDIFIDGDAVTRYRFSSGWASLDAGRVFGNRAELRAGLRTGWQAADEEIGSRVLRDVPSEGYGGLSARYTYDTRDRDALWQRGAFARVAYFRSEEALGGESPYDRLEGTATFSLPLRRNVGYLRVSGGSSFDTDLPIYDTFNLGGPVSLPGLSIGELRGTSYWSAQASYLQRIADISYVFGQSLYAGLAFTAADMSGRIDRIRAQPTYSGAFVLAGRTPLGPVSLSLAATTESDWNLVLGLGRPIEERTITDPRW
jgi:NTE family protein